MNIFLTKWRWAKARRDNLLHISARSLSRFCTTYTLLILIENRRVNLDRERIWLFTWSTVCYSCLQTNTFLTSNLPAEVRFLWHRSKHVFDIKSTRVGKRVHLVCMASCSGSIPLYIELLQKNVRSWPSFEIEEVSPIVLIITVQSVSFVLDTWKH